MVRHEAAEALGAIAQDQGNHLLKQHLHDKVCGSAAHGVLNMPAAALLSGCLSDSWFHSRSSAPNAALDSSVFG
jgi:hypothetical protein